VSQEGTGCYSLITNTKGGVIDDTVFSKHADRVYMVVNAGCAEKDVAHLREQLADFTKNGAKDVRMERLSHLSLVALQGPKAAAVVARLTDTDLKHFAFLDSRPAVVAGIPAILTRCGYTGEDGFEVRTPSILARACVGVRPPHHADSCTHALAIDLGRHRQDRAAGRRSRVATRGAPGWSRPP